MAKSEFISLLNEAILASGECVVGVSVDASGNVERFAAGTFRVDIAEQLSRELIGVAARAMSVALKNNGFERPRSSERAANANITTFDLDAAAEILKLSKYSLGKLAKDGAVPAAKIGKRWVFTDESLAEYLRSEIKKQTEARRGPTEEAKFEEKGPGPGFYPSGRRKPRPPPPLR